MLITVKTTILQTRICVG